MCIAVKQLRYTSVGCSICVSTLTRKENHMKTPFGCGSCSACCQVIGIPLAMPDKPVGDEFISKHWHIISRGEAETINPAMKVWPDESTFFTCDALKDGKCSLYSERPEVCSGFPYYDIPLEKLSDLISLISNYADPSEYGVRCRHLPDIIPTVAIT